MISKDILIDEALLSSDDSSDAEFDIWDVILHSLGEHWDYFVRNCVLIDKRHDSFHGIQAAHTVVVSSLVHFEGFNNMWNEFILNPIAAKLFGNFLDFCNTFIPHCSSSVTQVGGENLINAFFVGFWTKCNCHLAKQFKGSFSDSPVAILSHVRETQK